MADGAPFHVPGVIRASSLMRSAGGAAWSWEGLAGRLVELSSKDGSAQLTLAVGLVVDAQRHGEPVAWVMSEENGFFPPDVAEHGVDLESLVIVRIADVRTISRAGEMLVRSGAFGLIVLDLGENVSVPPPLLSRLVRLAEQRHTATLFLTIKPTDAASLGSLISLRGEARYVRTAEDSFACRIHILKDKSRAPVWTHQEECHGPVGLR